MFCRLGFSPGICCSLCLLVERRVLEGLSCGGLRVAHLVHVLTGGFPLDGCQVHLGTVFLDVLGLEVVLDLFGVVGGE